MLHRVTYMSGEASESEAELQHQRTALLELAESVASIGHWQIDLKEGRLYWSDEVFRIHGVTREEYSPEVESAIDFYHPDDAARVSSLVDSAISDRRPFDFECRLVRPDKSVRVVRARGQVQVDTNDEVLAVFGIFQDVTAERDAQRSLEQQVERYDLTMRGAGVGLWDWDLTSDEFHLSQRGARLTGLTRNGSGEAFLQSVILQDQKSVREALDAHLERQEVLDLACRVCPDNREIKWIRLCGEALFDDGGNALRMAGSLEDISEQKRHESLRAAMVELGQVEGPTSADRVAQLLQIGRRFLALDVALVINVSHQGSTLAHAEDPAGQLGAGQAVSADFPAFVAAAQRQVCLTDRDELLRDLVRPNTAGPHRAGDMIGFASTAADPGSDQPGVLVVFANRARNGRIFGHAARALVKVVALMIAHHLRQ